MEGLLDFGLCTNAYSRGQALRYAKTRKMREKQQEQLPNPRTRFTPYSSSSSSSSFFSYRRLRSPARKMDVSIDKQPPIEHRAEQYTRNLLHPDKKWSIPVSTQRLTFDVSSLNGELKGRSKGLVEQARADTRHAEASWLAITIDEVFELMGFDRILRFRYNAIKEDILQLTKNPSDCDESYRQAFHDADDEKVETAIRSQIEHHRATIEADSKNNKKVRYCERDWVFLGRFKKRKGWTMAAFLRKSFVYEAKLLKASETSPVNSDLLDEIGFYLTSITILRLRLDRRQLDNPNLHALLKACEEGDHIAASRSQHMYIESRMADIRAIES